MKPFLVNGIAAPQSIYEASTVRHLPIGTRGISDDGRVFYYGRYIGSSAIAAGKLCATAVLDTAHEDLDIITAGWSVGDKIIKDITIGATALTQDQYQYLCIVDSTNASTAATPGPEGAMFRIAGHGAYDASATTVRLNMYDPMPIGCDAGTQVSLIKSPFADFIVMTSASDLNDVVAGIPQCPIPAGNTTAQYVWLQTYGPAAAWVEGTPAEGAPLMPDTGTDGHLIVVTQSGTAMLTVYPHIGYQMGVDGVDDEVQAVDLRIRA